jgi:hypothetical protein
MFENINTFDEIFVCLQANSRRVCAEPVSTEMPIVSQQQKDITNSSSPENRRNQRILQKYFYNLHRRYWSATDIKSNSYDLLIARAFSILMWLCVVIIDFLTFSNLMKSSSTVLNFLFYGCYPWKEIYAIIYASGAAAYGISIEIYLIFPFIIVNTVLAIINCSIVHSATISIVAYFVKAVALCVATELTHQNFKRFTYQQSYKLHYQAATRVMLRQSIYIAITIMFVVSPGLRGIYNAARFKCPYSYKTTNDSYCNVIDIELPMPDHNDSCIADYTAIFTTSEQLRIIRDIALCSIAFYSMYNKAFLDITGTSSIIHKIVLALFITMSSSYIVASIDPFHFNKVKLFFNLIEFIVIFIVVLLLILNLRKNCRHRNEVIMEKNPTIWGS